ncbi:MAG: tetratricopeptide repeat protein [Bacteroidetes bacterium]|nr:tetratricopeptide repeat protein [Bacteroidota bacterium]
MEEITQKRQLAAIMFTDIVGYTALMGKDTDKALELIRISKEIQKPLVEKHNGRWLKEMGDGSLSSFNSALDAVNCSIEIQEIARGKLDAKLRIGIHLGDVTVEQDDVYGDGVNVASRLESIADPGGIYISESIEKAIKGQTDIQAKYLGEAKLKNVDYGVRTYALQGVGLPIPEVKDGEELSGHFIAELQRRGVPRAGATYVVLSLLLILLVPYAKSLVDLPLWSTTALLTVLIVGLPIALYLAWNYERSPEGFVRTTSQQSWQNRYSAAQRKPLTSTFIIAGLSLVIVVMFLYPRYIDKGVESSGSGIITDKSIAVMAFVDMSANKDQEYFADGISEEIINNLAQIKELRVIGRSSSFQFKGQNRDLREVGDKLGVSTVLEGSVRKSGNRLRITVQLINVEDGSHIWSKSYDRELDDIFKIQDEISLAIAEQMKVSLGLTKSNPVDFKVYDLYLRARTLLNQRGPGVEQSIRLFEQVLEIDSSYQPAWTGLANAWLVMPIFSTIDTLFGNTEITLPRAENAARKALALNPEDAETLAVIGSIYRDQKEWSKAYEYYEQAMSFNDQSTVILEDYVQFLLQLGYAKKSLPFAQRMIDLDPFTPLYQMVYARVLGANDRNQDAIEALKKGVRINPHLVFLRNAMFLMYLNMNQLDSALYILHNYDFREDVRNDYLSQIEAVKNSSSEFDFQLQNPLYFAMNELDQLDAFYDRLLSESENRFAWLGVWSVYSPQGLTYHSERFISDPRFKQVIENYGILDFWKEYGWPDRCKAVGEDDFVCE